MSEDLRDKITAAIDRAEQVARAAAHKTSGEWHQTDPDREEGRIEDELGDVVVYDEGSPTGWQAEHIALHDPASVLRRCAADRRVLERHRPTRWPNIEDGYDAPTCAGCGRDDHGEPRYLVPCPEITDCADRWGVDA